MSVGKEFHGHSKQFSTDTFYVIQDNRALGLLVNDAGFSTILNPWRLTTAKTIWFLR
jgi:hypothetical protein